ncbi:hypothetical protein PLESTB_001234600 [Pleodorina starrii]|uniref:Uncharacterized protein n=1 Tax=Pleodorina starrii TaxID=330485 RepID=A0A9W6BSN4_9CHLO|nr:hypothetical protein PLESTB_001234600 [Pleodorina starrii]
MPSQASHVTIAEETAAPSSMARPAMVVPTPTVQVKKGIPKAPMPSTSSAARPSPSRQQPFARITTRLPAAPATITCPPSSSTSGPQQPVEEQPCSSRDERRSPLTSDLCAINLLRSASSSSCGGCPSSSLSASSSCSLGSSSSDIRISTTTSNISSFPASDSPSFPASSAASSSAERPTSSLPSSSSQAEQEPRTASDDTEPHSCCCTAPPPIAAATPRAMTAQGSSPAKLEELRQLARLEEIRQRLLKTLRPGSATAVPEWPQTTDEERIAYLDHIKQRLLDCYFRLNGRLPPNYDCAGPVPQAPAPLAAATVAEAVPVCASPRPSMATETEKEEAPAPDAPSEAAAQLSKGPRRKLSKILRGLFGGCVGRNVEAL